MTALRFIARRGLALVLVLVGISTLLFVLLRLSGDPLTMLLGPENRSEELEAAMRRQYGFDQPIEIQYLRFLAGIARFDFGNSLQSRGDAMALVLSRVAASAQLAGAAAALAVIVALPIGIYSAVRRRSPVSRLVMLIALVAQATPAFAFGILLILVFAVGLRWIPSGGAGTPMHLIAPAVALSGFLMAKLARLARSGMLEVIEQDYMRTARAKGIPPRTVIVRHGLRNMLIPIVTVLGLEIPHLLGTAVVVETVFAWPGLGRQMVAAVLARDYPVVQATVFLIAVVAVLVNVIVDLLYGVLDPRVKLS